MSAHPNYRAPWRLHLACSESPLRRVEVADEPVDAVLVASLASAVKTLQAQMQEKDREIAELQRRVRDLRVEAA